MHASPSFPHFSPPSVKVLLPDSGWSPPPSLSFLAYLGSVWNEKSFLSHQTQIVTSQVVLLDKQEVLSSFVLQYIEKLGRSHKRRSMTALIPTRQSHSILLYCPLTSFYQRLLLTSVSFSSVRIHCLIVPWIMFHYLLWFYGEGARCICGLLTKSLVEYLVRSFISKCKNDVFIAHQKWYAGHKEKWY